jgi:hypothetical protein
MPRHLIFYFNTFKTLVDEQAHKLCLSVNTNLFTVLGAIYMTVSLVLCEDEP